MILKLPDQNRKLRNKKCKSRIIERQKQIELEEKEILRRERQYDSEVKKKADADRYAVEQAAAAEKEDKSLKRMPINIVLKQRQKQKRTIRVDGLAKADAQRAQGESEAEIIRLKGLAEAEANGKLPKHLNSLAKQLFWIWF